MADISCRGHHCETCKRTLIYVLQSFPKGGASLYRYCLQCQCVRSQPVPRRELVAYGIELGDLPIMPSKKQAEAGEAPPPLSARLKRGSGGYIKDMRTAEELRRLSYKDYLKTVHWKAMKDKALARAKHRCQVCNSSEKLNVHHRTYDRLGEEKLSDLTVLCRVCHSKFHGVDF